MQEGNISIPSNTMIKTLSQQLEDWWVANDYPSILQTLNGLSIEKFTPRMWEMFVMCFLEAGFDSDEYHYFERALNTMLYMESEKIELFKDFGYYKALLYMTLNRESEALDVLGTYFKEVPSEDWHEDAERLDEVCVKRLSLPSYPNFGHFLSRLEEAAQKLLPNLPRIETLMQEIDEILKSEQPDEDEVENLVEERDAIMDEVTRDFHHYVEWSTGIRESGGWVLCIMLTGACTNLHVVNAMCHYLSEVLPDNWDIQLMDWAQFVEKRYGEDFLDWDFKALRNHEQPYTTDLPDKMAMLDVHVGVEKAWSTDGAMVNGFLQEKSYPFDVLRVVGCFSASLCYDTELLSEEEGTMEERVRAYNAKIEAFVREQGFDESRIAFTGGGYGAAAFPGHAGTAYCDFIAFDGANVSLAFQQFFSTLEPNSVFVHAFHRDAESLELTELTELTDEDCEIISDAPNEC